MHVFGAQEDSKCFFVGLSWYKKLFSIVQIRVEILNELCMNKL